MEKIVIREAEYEIVRTTSNNKNAVAKLKGRQIYISIPSRWPNSEKERVFQNLKQRSIRAIEKERWAITAKQDMEFSNGQEIAILGDTYRIEIIAKQTGNVLANVCEGKIELSIPEKHNELKNEIVKRTIMRFFKDKLKGRVEQKNREHFGSAVGEISIREADTRWGSCSSKNDIMISLRLLFMPLEIIDYVIVHELAHTKYRGHGIRFWQCVEKVIPDYLEKKKWLKRHGNSYPKKHSVAIEQQGIVEIVDEPYD